MKWTLWVFALSLVGVLESVGSPGQGKSAKELYLANCASCHGEKGDGQGTAQLERRARSFVDGGFSYGNTPKAIRRTLLSGIPGTAMPAWRGALTEDQIRRVADYVIELGPGLPPAPSGTEMVVGDRPQVVRGFLPPISSSAGAHPRGLLVGLPDGFSFEYRTDDLRLLGMRQGRFVDRTDWVGRGGTALEPLGPVVLLEAGGAPPATFALVLGEEHLDLRSRLRGTRIAGGEVWVHSQLLGSDGEPLVEVRERVRAQHAPFGSGYLRTWHLRALDQALQLEFGDSHGNPGDVSVPGLLAWKQRNENRVLGDTLPSRNGADLWLLPAFPIVLEAGQTLEVNLCRLRLTPEALAKPVDKQ